MKTILRSVQFLVIFLFAYNSLSAQPPGWAWSHAYGSTGSESVDKVAANSSDAVFAYGTFTSTMLPVGPHTLVNAGDKDLFLITHDTTGTLEWAQSFGGSGSETAGGMGTDADGNVIISGTFQNSITIGSNTFTAAGTRDIFVAKINRLGSVIWAKQFGGSGIDSAYTLKCDVSGNIYLTGAYTSSILTIGGFPLPSGDAFNVFYCKLDASGTALWAKKASSPTRFSLDGIDFLNSDKVVFFGNSGGQPTLNFNTAGGPMSLSTGTTPFFVSTSLSGNFLSQKAGSPYSTFSTRTGAAIGMDESIYYSGRAAFLSNPYPTSFQVKTNQDNADIRSTQVGPLAPGPQRPESLAFDIVFSKDHRLFTVGFVQGPGTFQNGFTTPSWSMDDKAVYVWQTDTTLKTTGLLYSTPTQSVRSELHSISVDSANNSLFTGGYINGQSVGLQFIIGPDTLLTKGEEDILISKVSINGYNPRVPPYMEIGKDTFLCAGNSVNIGSSAGAIWGQAPYTYSWSPATGLADASSPYTLATPFTSQTYVLKITDAASTVVYDTIHIQVGSMPPTPTINASGPLTFCDYSPLTLTASTGHNYLWSNGATTQSITVNSSGTFAVRDSIASGCVSAYSAPVTVTAVPRPATPVVSPVGPVSICEGNSVTLTSTPGDEYIWNPGFATTQSITVTQSGSYRVWHNSQGCTSLPSEAVVVTVNPVPAALTITPNGPLTFCNGNTVTLTASAINAGHVYVWSNGETTQSITVTNSGTYTVKDSIPSGCVSALSAPTVVTVNPVPATPTITSGSLSFCEGSFVTLTANGGSSYLWSNNAATQTITVNTSGTFTVISSALGCTSLPSLPVITTAVPVPATPSISASGPLAVCAGSSVTLTSSAGHNYLWSTGATTQNITVSTAGNYTLTDSVPGCRSLASSPAIISITPLPATPSITVGGPLAFCAGENVVLTSSAGHNYLWSTGATSQSITVASTAIVFVKDSASGCKSLPSANVNVTVNSLPPVPVITQAGNTLTSSAATGNQWYYNGNIISGATSNQYTYSIPGEYTVTVTNTNGCSVTSANHTAGFTNGFTTSLRNGETFLHFISPNPMQANSFVNFNLKSASEVSIIILGENGFKVAELLKNQRLTAGDHRVAMSNNFFKLRAGVYFITYFINGEKVIDKVIVGK